MLLYVLAYAPLAVIWGLLTLLFGFWLALKTVIISYAVLAIVFYFVISYLNDWKFFDTEIIKNSVQWPLALVWIVAMLEQKK